MPAQITSPAGNRLTQSGPADQMNLLRILAQIVHGALPENSLAQSRPAYPTRTHSMPSMTCLFGPSPPRNSSTKSGSVHPMNTPSTTGTLPLFLPTLPGNSSIESGSAHPTNAPSTTSTPLLFTLFPRENSRIQSVSGDPANDLGTYRRADLLNYPGTSALGEIILIISPCFGDSLTKKTYIGAPYLDGHERCVLFGPDA